MSKEVWNLTKEQREKFKPLVEEYVEKLNNGEELDELNFTFEGISPMQLRDLLVELGYSEDEDEGGFDSNGWQCDFWWTFINENKKEFARKLTMSGCGMTFNLKLSTGVD